MKEQEILDSISVGIQGKVLGFRYKGETLADAASRCVLEAERFGNEGKARIHLDIKPEVEPMPGQSQFAATLAKALMTQFTVQETPGANLGDLRDMITAEATVIMTQQFAEIIDKEVDNIRDAFKDLPPCPIITHPEGPCSFCAAYALRDILVLKEV